MAPRIVDKAERRASIVQAATEVFAAKGYRAATMAEIGQTAGIGKGTIYLYFPSKQDIFLAVFEAYASGMVEQFKKAEAVAHQDGAAELLRRLNRLAVEALVEMQPIYSLVLEFWSVASLEELKEVLGIKFRRMYTQFRALIAGLIRRGIESGEFCPEVDAEAVASMYIGAIDGLGLQIWLDDGLDPVAIGEGFLEVVLRGLMGGGE